MAMIEPEGPGSGAQQQADWEAQMIRDLGKWTRKVREFLGFSQDKLAKLADVSQGAVSRVEAGRGKATPLLTFTKINQVFAKALSEIDPAMLTKDAQEMLERARYMAKPVPDHHQLSSLALLDPVVAQVLAEYQSLPERAKPGFLTVLRATATSLGSHAHAMDESPVQRAARTPN
jgi:transcriptional regulator with XRE-family HTH domain